MLSAIEEDAPLGYLVCVTTADLADAYNRAGDVAFAGARYDEAEDRYRSGRAAAERSGADRAGADASLGLARVHARLGEYAESVALYRGAQAYYESAGAAVGVGDCIAGVAGLDADRGRHAAAEAAYLTALERYPADATRHIARCRLSLAELLTDTGRFVEAEVTAREAARTFGSMNDRAALADCALAAAEAQLRGGDPDSAEATLVGLRETFQGLGVDDKVAECAAALAATIASVGQTNEAVAHYRSALDTFERLGLDDEAADCLYNLARLTAPADAARYASRARELYRGLGQVIDVARTDLAAADIFATGAKSLSAAVDIAIPAMLYVDSQRFQFPTARARIHWSATVEREMAVVFGWAHRIGDHRLVAELVEVDINFGMPSRSTEAASPLIRVTRSSRHTARRPEQAGPARLVAGAYLPMTAGPRIRMPDGRIALLRYFDLMEDRYGRLGEAPPALR